MQHHHFRWLIAFGLAASVALAEAPPLTIAAVAVAAPADPQAVPRYGKLELLVTLADGVYTQPYDPRPAHDGLDLQATFSAPDATQQTVCGYFDGATWRVRFAPTQVGDWTYALAAVDRQTSATWAGGSFRCVASAAPGFAHLDGLNLRFADGAVRFPIGVNNGWQYDVEQPAFAELAPQGINLLSFWLNTPWLTPADPQPRAPIENVTDGPGVYYQAACAYLDGVVARAEAAGVFLLPTIWSHGNLRQTGTHPWGDGWWDKLAYSSVCSAADFFQTTANGGDTPQWAYQKNFYRYLLARWGYSRAIVAWVMLCEIEGTTGYQGTGADPVQARAWCAAVRDYLAANDFYRRAADGSYPATVTKSDSSPDAPTWDNGCDLAACDSYTAADSDLDVAPAIATQTLAMRGAGRPAFHAEFGGNVDAGATEPSHLHNGIWAGFATGACLAPLKWCDGGDWPLLTDFALGTALQDQLKFLAQFVGQIAYLGAPELTAATVTAVPDTLRGWGRHLDDRGFAWLQNPLGPMGGQAVTVSTLTAGRYQVVWYDTWKNAADQVLPPDDIRVGADGVLVLTVPTLARGDLAVRFARVPSHALAGIEATALTCTGGGAAVPLTATLTVTDPDSANVVSATVQITANYQNGQDVLALPAAVGPVTGVWTAATGTLALTGAGTSAQYQNALRSVNFRNTIKKPVTLVRTVSITVNDGTADSNTVTRAVNVKKKAALVVSDSGGSGACTLGGASSGGASLLLLALAALAVSRRRWPVGGRRDERAAVLPGCPPTTRLDAAAATSIVPANLRVRGRPFRLRRDSCDRTTVQIIRRLHHSSVTAAPPARPTPVGRHRP